MSKWSQFDYEQAQAKLARARAPQAAAASDAAKAEKYAAGQEKRLSAEFCAWLTVKGIPHIVARTDRKSTIQSGWPDVTAMRGSELCESAARVCCVELKCEGNKLSPEQEKCHARLRVAGIPVLTAYNLKDACDFIIRTLLK